VAEGALVANTAGSPPASTSTIGTSSFRNGFLRLEND
jgi:hypothetical protein